MNIFSRYWIAVASGDHVALGKKLGIMQVCHGKAAPLRRILPGDIVIYYSPTLYLGDKERLQSFTAIGTVCEGQPYQVEMSENFIPWRRDVKWSETHNVPIQSLLNHLSFTQGIKNWGYKFRFGLFEITKNDADMIAKSMELK